MNGYLPFHLHPTCRIETHWLRSLILVQLGIAIILLLPWIRIKDYILLLQTIFAPEYHEEVSNPVLLTIPSQAPLLLPIYTSIPQGGFQADTREEPLRVNINNPLFHQWVSCHLFIRTKAVGQARFAAVHLRRSIILQVIRVLIRVLVPDSRIATVQQKGVPSLLRITHTPKIYNPLITVHPKGKEHCQDGPNTITTPIRMNTHMEILMSTIATNHLYTLLLPKLLVRQCHPAEFILISG